MLWFAAVLCYLSAIYHIWINRGRLNTVGVLVSLVWGTVNMINAITPYDWYPLSERCKLILLIGSFALVFGLLTGKRSSYPGGESIDQTTNLRSGYRFFFLFQLLLAVVMLPMVVKAVTILIRNNWNMAALRTIYATGGESGSYMSTFERLFYIHYIVGPCTSACILTDALLFYQHRLWKKPLYYILLLAVLESVYSAARTIIFFSAISLFIAYLIYRGRIRSNCDLRKVRRRIRRILLVLAGFMLVITMMRGNTKSGTISYAFKTLITYFCGGTRLLNQTIENPLSFGLDTYTYGYCTFAGFFSILNVVNMYLLGRFGLNPLPMNFAAELQVQDFISRNVHIGTASIINAFPTMYYFFLRDGGILFLVAAVFLFSRFITFYEKRSARRNSLKSSFTYGLLFYVSIMTVCWWEPIRTEFWMTLLWGRLLCRMVEKRKTHG